MGIVSEPVLPDFRAMPAGVGRADQLSLQESAVEYRFHGRELVYGHVSLGEVDTAEGSGETASDVGSCRVFARSDGDHDRNVLGIDRGAAAKLREGNYIDNGSGV